jgi:serpin B
VSNRTNAGIAQLLRGVRARYAEGFTDGQLLRQFLAQRDEAAFTALVKRYGPMVLGVCRRILGNAADAEDAFQATFLVLVRKAGSLTGHAVLGDFLHGVARRTALNARRLSTRRRMKERAMARPEVQGEEVRDDWLPLLDEELGRLPDKYRVPIVLCDLEGKTRGEAAQRLGWPPGTVAGRLARGRAMLATRLARRGVTVSVGAVVALVSHGGASAAVPPMLVTSTVEAATLFAAGYAASGVISAEVVALSEGVVKSMFVSKLKSLAAAAVLTVLITAALGYAELAAERPIATGDAAAKPAALPEDRPQQPAKVADQPVEAPPADVAALVKGDTAFALDLYKQLCKEKDAEKGNLFLSPFSISSALALASAGARGDTLTEMETALHLPAQDRLHPAFAVLNRQTNGGGEKRGYQLRTANALWGQKDHGFQPAFLKLTKDHYGAGLNEVDFAGDAEGARKTINTWVERETQDKIKELLKPGVITGTTRLVLTNAIYFKGDWAIQFKEKFTRELPFVRGDGGKVKVPMMFQSAVFKHYYAEDLQALEMPYAGKELSMLVLLPAKADGLPALEKGLTADRLSEIVGKLEAHEVDVSLPRFKTTVEFQLNETLQALGMKKAFMDGSADFSGIDGRRDLHISAVVHKAFVEVNEKGTEAAAATGVVFAVSKPPDFTADHPFLFLIRDRRNGSILFLGRINDPTK